MTTVFVYEYCCALGLGRVPSDPAHSLYREGRAMRDDVAEDFRQIPGMEVLTLDCCGGLSEERQFRSIADTADHVLLIAPELDEVLAIRSVWSIDHDCNPIGPGYGAIRLASDKLQLAEHWARAGVMTPTTTRIEEWPGDHSPVVFKPRHGAGSTAILAARHASELGSARRKVSTEYDQSLIAQDYVPGLAASASFLVGPLQTVPLLPAFQLLSTDGRFRYEGGELPIPPDLAFRAITLGRKAIDCVPGLLGYVGVDLVLGDAADGSQDYAIEINPRLTTSYVGLRELADFNLAGAMLRVVNSEPVEPRWKSGRVRFRPDGTVSVDPTPGPTSG